MLAMSPLCYCNSPLPFVNVLLHLHPVSTIVQFGILLNSWLHPTFWCVSQWDTNNFLVWFFYLVQTDGQNATHMSLPCEIAQVGSKGSLFSWMPIISKCKTKIPHFIFFISFFVCVIWHTFCVVGLGKLDSRSSFGTAKIVQRKT